MRSCLSTASGLRGGEPNPYTNYLLTKAGKTVILFCGILCKEVRGLVSRMLFFGGLMTVYAENIKGNSSILALQGRSLPKNAAKEPLSRAFA